MYRRIPTAIKAVIALLIVFIGLKIIMNPNEVNTGVMLMIPFLLGILVTWSVITTILNASYDLTEMRQTVKVKGQNPPVLGKKEYLRQQLIVAGIISCILWIILIWAMVDGDFFTNKMIFLLPVSFVFPALRWRIQIEK